MCRVTRARSVECEDGLGLACAAPADAVLRRAHPEGRFPAVELTRPGLTNALAAVNEQGLAAALAGRFGSRGGCQAPAALLIRDCVERFDRVEAAVDWCMTRPAAPGTTILLADSTGALASVAITATAREILTPTIGGAGASFTHVLHPRGAGLAPLSPRAACTSP